MREIFSDMTFIYGIVTVVVRVALSLNFSNTGDDRQ